MDIAEDSNVDRHIRVLWVNIRTEKDAVGVEGKIMLT